MHEHRRALRLCTRDQLVAQCPDRCASRSAPFACSASHEIRPGSAIGSQSARIVVDDVLDGRALLAQIEDLVDLLLVFGQHETRAGLVDEVADFIQRGVRECRHRRIRRARRPPACRRRAAAGCRRAPASRRRRRNRVLSSPAAQPSTLSSNSRHVVCFQMPLLFSRIATRCGKAAALRASTRISVVSTSKFQGDAWFSGRHARLRYRLRPPAGRRPRRPVRRCRSWRHSSAPACDRRCR